MPSVFSETGLFQSSKVPLCRNKAPSVFILNDGTVRVKPHPGWAAWDRKYRSVDVWVRKNPGQVAGRLLGEPPVAVYYSFQYSYGGGSRFNYSLAPPYDSRPVPDGAVVYEDFAAWAVARGK